MAEGHQASIREHKPSLHLHSQHGYRHFQPNHLHLVDSDGNTVEWQSRRARKGRYSSKRHHLATGDSSSAVSIRLRSLEDELKPHLTLDVSFWVAVFFTLGSVVWVVNGTLDADPLIPGFLVWLPLVYAEMQRPAVSKTAAALAFLGGTLFEVGSYLMVVEALDRGRETNFGTSLYRLLKNAESTVATDGREPSSSEDTDWPADKPGFVWWGKPMWDNMGYVAVGCVSCISPRPSSCSSPRPSSGSRHCTSDLLPPDRRTGLPDVIPGLGEGHHRAVADVFFWSPQGESAPPPNSSNRRNWLRRREPHSHARSPAPLVGAAATRHRLAGWVECACR